MSLEIDISLVRSKSVPNQHLRDQWKCLTLHFSNILTVNINLETPTFTWKSHSECFNDDKATYCAQIMTQCFQAVTHYIHQSWPRSMTPYGFNWPHWVKSMVHANIALCLREHHVKLIFKKSIQNYANWFSFILLACSLNPHPPSANWSLKIELLPISKCWNQKCRKNKILSRKRPLNNVACFPGVPFTNINELQFQHGLVITVIVKCGMKLSNFKSCMIEVWEWTSNFIPHFTRHVITYPCWD